jgi:hypothetical protein
MLPDHHSAAITEITETLIPAAESALKVLRRPLAVELDKYIDSICTLIRPDLQRALMICGRPMDPAKVKELDPVVEEVRAQREVELRALLGRLSSSEPISIAAFIDPLVVALEAAMQVQTTIAEKPVLERSDLVVLVEGDAAFRTLYHFLDVLKPVMEKVQPRSVLSLRSQPTNKPR